MDHEKVETACACTRVRRAARAITKVYDDALADTGLKVTQFALLRAIQRVGEAHISRLAEATGLDRSTLGRNLRPLRESGLIGYDAGEDQRAVVFSLTPAGSRAIARALPRWERTQAHVGQRLGRERTAELFELLSQVEALAD